MYTRSIILLYTALLLFSCNTGKKENEKAIADFVNYVDSLKQVVDAFHQSGDTNYVNNIIDPNGDPEDPFNHRIDTIITSHSTHNYFTGRTFAGITISDDLLQEVEARYRQKRESINEEEAGTTGLNKIKESEAIFNKLVTEYK